MLKLFNLFKYGFITIFTIPVWLVYLLYCMIKGLVFFVFNSFKAIILFFKGRSIFKTDEDLAIEKLIRDENAELERKRKEALDSVK